MSKRVLWLLSMLTATSAMAQKNPNNWIEVRSPAFTVITDSSEKQARRIAVQFERMRELFEQAYPQMDSDPDSAVIVLAPKAKKDFLTLEPENYQSRRSLRLHGLFLRASPEKSYILMRLDSEGGNPFPVVYHEYTHLVLSEADNSMPLWLNEGLAEFYENTSFYDQNVILGEANQKHLMLLRFGKLLPLSTLFTINEKSPYYTDENHGSIFYAESWALTHYLTLKDYGDKTTKVREYTELVRRGSDPVIAAARVFGDLKKLQRALNDYIEQQSFNHFKAKNIEMIDDSTFETRPLKSLEVEAVQADYLACYGRVERARILLKDILQRDPQNASAQETLAFLEIQDQAHAEEELRRAIRENPDSASTHHELSAYLWKNQKNLEESVSLAARATSLDPSNLGYRLNLADILVNMGRVQMAAETLRESLGLAQTKEELEAVNRLLSETTAAMPGSSSRPIPDPPDGTVTASMRKRSVLPDGPHRFVVGVLKAVHCEPPRLDLTVASRSATLTLHAENYFKIQFTALFTPTGELQPCDDLEDRPARVEYVESADSSDPPRLVAVELRK